MQQEQSEGAGSSEEATQGVKRKKKDEEASKDKKAGKGGAYTVTDYVRDRLLRGDADLDASDTVRAGHGGNKQSRGKDSGLETKREKSERTARGSEGGREGGREREGGWETVS